MLSFDCPFDISRSVEQINIKNTAIYVTVMTLT